MKDFYMRLKVNVLKHGDTPKLILAGFNWPEVDLQLCAHGEKLRWSCDECEEYFKKHPLLANL